MTRWLLAAREGLGTGTKPTQPTKPAPEGRPDEVLSVKSVLSEEGEVGSGLPQDLCGDLLDAWEERAAIREYDGAQTRGEAERGALRELGLAVRFFVPETDKSERGSAVGAPDGRR